MIKIQRNKNETYISYVKRIVQMVRDGLINYSEMGDALLGDRNVYSNDNLRKFYYVIDKMVDKFDENITITDNEILKEIEHQRDEIFKETVRLRDKKREISNDLRLMARFENLERVLKDELSLYKPISYSKIVTYTPKQTQASLLISDIHYGIEIDNQFNFYNTETAKEYIFKIIEKTIAYCKFYKIKRLNVELLGDLVSGIINLTARVEQEEDIISQIIQISNILVEAISQLNKEIPEVCVYSVFGNHSRINPNKKENLNRENLERLIYYYIKTQIPNIKMVTSLNDDFLEYKIDNKKIVLVHGDKDKPDNAVLNIVRLLGYKPDEVHMGHYHHFSITDDNDTEIICNGSLVSTDDYAMSIRKSTKPSQVLRIYGSDNCTYNLTVD